MDEILINEKIEKTRLQLAAQTAELRKEIVNLKYYGMVPFMADEEDSDTNAI